jgi:cathepsin X
MMNEIYQRGPITCAMGIPDDFLNYTGGIYWDKSGYDDYDHDISITGWGVENGTKYWIVRNSWGSHWGEDGNFRVVRGINNINIESVCSWAVPRNTWAKDERN